MSTRKTVRLLLLRLFARLTGARPEPAGPPRRGRVLLLRPDHIGDLLFATPTLRLLRRSWPEAHLALAVGPWGLPVVRDNPCLDELLTVDFPGFSRRPKGSLLAPYRLLWQEAARLKQLRFDLAINLRFDFWWGALLAYAAGIPWRLGYDVPEVRPFLTTALRYRPGRHEVEQNWHLGLAALGQAAPSAPGALEFHPTPQESRAASAWLDGQAAGASFLCVHPGAGWPVKLWRPDAFAAVADALAHDHGAQVVLVGGPGEEQLVEAVARGMRARPLRAIGLDLGAVAAILARSILTVGADSGITHLAAAMGAPTVQLFGPVDCRLFGPWGDPRLHAVVTAGLPCAPCNRLDYPQSELALHPCVRDVEPAAVLEAAQGVLRQATLEAR